MKYHLIKFPLECLINSNTFRDDIAFFYFRMRNEVVKFLLRHYTNLPIKQLFLKIESSVKDSWTLSRYFYSSFPKQYVVYWVD